MNRRMQAFPRSLALVGATLCLSSLGLAARPFQLDSQLLSDPGLNSDSDALLSYTTNNTYGRWLEENASLVTGMQDGVSPWEGDGMLRIQEDTLSASQVRQRIDITADAAVVDLGGVTAIACARLNGPAGGISGGILVRALTETGVQSDASSGALVLDGSIGSWELSSASLLLPVGTRYIEFQFSFSNSSFPGGESVYADGAHLTLFQTCPSDDCANAGVVTIGSTPIDTRFSTTDGLALDPLVCDIGPFGTSQIFNECWYLFTPPITQSYKIAMTNGGGPSFDNRLAVYDQSTCPDDPANVIGCDDDSGPGLEAEICFPSLTAGTTYLIRAGSFQSTTVAQPSQLVITTGCVQGPLPGPGDNCPDPVFAVFGLNPVDSTDASDGTGQPLDPFVCDLGPFGDEQIYDDLWFSFTAPTTESYDIAVVNNGNPSFDTRIAVYDQSTCPDDPANVIACDDDSGPGFEAAVSSVPLAGGSVYTIRIGSYDGSTIEELAALSIGVADLFSSSCNGDGGDQAGCTDCPCSNNAPQGTVGGCVNSAGTSTAIDATGDPSVSLPAGETTDLRFTLSGAPANALCVMLSGDAVAPQNGANPCFGSNSGVQSIDRGGLRCAVQGLRRHGGRSANGMGDIMDASGPSRVWGGEAQPGGGLAVQGGFSAGQTRYFQVTHREDAMLGCMRGLNTSQAVSVTFTP